MDIDIKQLLLVSPGKNTYPLTHRANVDFGLFTFSKKYTANAQEFKLFFDFDLRQITGHNKKTFDHYRSLLYFLQNNPNKIIYITNSSELHFYEEGDKLVINLGSYTAFCNEIGRNGKERTQAFLAQKLKHYSEDEKRKILADSTQDEIIGRIDKFLPDEKRAFLEKLKIDENTFPASTAPEAVKNLIGVNNSWQPLISAFESLDAEAQNNVINSLPALKNGDKSIVITDENKKAIFDQILKAGYSDDFWKILSETDPSLADKLSAGQIQIKRQKVITELKKRLTETYSETAGDDSWQRWIYSNTWLFGVNYEQPIEKLKINLTGVMPDFLFPTLDGFIDLLEIKLPAENVIQEDTNHRGSWVWSSAVNSAIGQVVNYLSEIDRLKLEIEKEIERVYFKKTSILKPRAFILIGESHNWSMLQREGLRKLNHSLHGIEVITYTDLVQRGEGFLKI